MPIPHYHGVRRNPVLYYPRPIPLLLRLHRLQSVLAYYPHLDYDHLTSLLVVHHYVWPGGLPCFSFGVCTVVFTSMSALSPITTSCTGWFLTRSNAFFLHSPRCVHRATSLCIRNAASFRILHKPHRNTHINI